MCSPYLTGSLGIMLCLVTFNYWSVSTQNSDLVKKAEEMQQQLQLGSKHIHSLEEEIRDVRKQVKSCKEKLTEERELKKDVEFKFKDMSDNRDKLQKKISELVSEGDEVEKKKIEQEEELESLKQQLRESKDQSVMINANLTACHSELASERAEKLAAHPQAANIPPRHLPNAGGLGPGQLPNVDPNAVSVIRKETQGMKFHKDKNGHWLPILPPGDPNMPRAKPNVSVMDLAENKRVKKHALVGAGLSIVDKAGKPLDFDSKSASPSPKVMNLSTSKKPVGSSSEGSEVKAQQVGVVPAPKIVDNEAGVMPLPLDLGKPADESKAGSENLDNAEDDSHIAAIENGPEGNKEIQDDDQNPDGQIDETVDLDKQHYLVDKALEESVAAEDGVGPEKAKDEVENSLENGIADNLDTLKESLNNNENL